MYKRQRKGWSKHLDFIILDLICLWVSYLLAYFLRNSNIGSLFESRFYINIGIVLMIIDFLVILFFNTMHNVLKRGILQEFINVAKENLLLFGLTSIYLFSVKDAELLSRIMLWTTLLLHILISYIVFLAWKKVVYRRYYTKKQKTILLVADKVMASDVIRRFRNTVGGSIEITGLVLADKNVSSGSIEGVPIVSSIAEAPHYICREWIDEVYVSTAIPPQHLINCCIEMGVTIHRELHTFGSESQFVEKIANEYCLTSTMKAATPVEMFLKRAMDIVGGIVGSLIALVIMAIIGPKIKKASPGPILFKQERIGQNGKHFKMYKIRSMVMNADEKKKELMAQNRVSNGMMFKLDFDPRIIGNEILPDGTHKTGIGEFIRSTSIDELPQFFNVLKGEMSLVGTRPPTVDEWEKYEFHHRRRLSIKPGVTGMWQVSGRSGITDFEEVVKLDAEYINNWSLVLDIKILLKTIVKVITRDGAM
ncbi:MAG: sugar transferase [Parasporobacterium sp.]|nr:sugar transferase [Parasporobacterium sp.]